MPHLSLDAHSLITKCPCGCILDPGSSSTECPECGLSGGDMGYYNENDLVPEKELCFE
jgi:hypothetical protein